MARVYNQPRRMRGARRMLKPFAGVDGEGGDINGKHEYLLLRAGDYALETGSPLGTYECFAFLADLPKDVIYVSFAFDYDVTMMIRHLHPAKIDELFNRPARVILDKDGKPTSRYWPVKVGHEEFEIDYMPHKEFRVRRKGGKWTVISDVFTFFQSSFVRALQKWFGDDDRYSPIIERIAIGKEQRASFGAVTQDEREYNLLEIRMLERLMEKFRGMCTELNIHPTKWQGPGNLVSAVFKREGLPSKKDNNIPVNVWLFAVTGYYGGRFECATYGHIDGPVYQYDINSAYASHYKHLPCLVHGGWKRLRRLPPGDSDVLFVADVSFRHNSEMSWYTLPVRTVKGTLAFPREGRGVYWMHEIRVAQQHAELTLNEGWQYVRNCECRWFDWVYALYDERDRVGKDSGKGKVLKIVLATIYGKLAQSKGQPLWANPIWSGLVVSYCRATLASAALQVDGGDDVYMLATDGMFCGTPRSLTVGKALGEWTRTDHSEMFCVQSGVYFTPGEKPKTRGVPQSKVIEYEQVFRDTWREWLEKADFGFAPEVQIPLRVFVAARLAHARGKPWQAGRWTQAVKRVRFDWSTKRSLPVRVRNHVRTRPVEGGPWLVSLPPKYAVGGEVDPDSLLDADQPDWAQKFLNDDDVG